MAVYKVPFSFHRSAKSVGWEPQDHSIERTVRMRNLARYPKSADRDRPGVIPYPENVISFQERGGREFFSFNLNNKSSGPWENPKIR